VKFYDVPDIEAYLLPGTALATPDPGHAISGFLIIKLNFTFCYFHLQLQDLLNYKMLYYLFMIPISPFLPVAPTEITD
jgi:hypothetical protein